MRLLPYSRVISLILKPIKEIINLINF